MGGTKHIIFQTDINRHLGEILCAFLMPELQRKDRKEGVPLANINEQIAKAEVATLTNKKDRLYREVRKLREEVSETETIKRCIEQTIKPQEHRKEQTKSKAILL